MLTTVRPWMLGSLNMAVLWAYQTLMSAQNYYAQLFPDDNIEFWGTVCAGTAMFVAHIVQLYWHLYRRWSFRSRLVFGYIGYMVVGILLILPPLQSATTILSAFVAVGVLNTLTESPLITLASLFDQLQHPRVSAGAETADEEPTSTTIRSGGGFVEAINVGNGLAGVLAVACYTWIRLALRHTADTESFHLFVGLLLCLSLYSLVMVHLIVETPYIASALTQLVEQQSHEADESCFAPVSWWTVCKRIWRSVFTEWFTLFISLMLWPGLACRTVDSSQYPSLYEWWCTPVVIGAFNVGDIVGRAMAGWLRRRWPSALTDCNCVWWSIVRIVFVVIVPHRGWSPAITAIAVFLLAVSNGILVSLALMPTRTSRLGIDVQASVTVSPNVCVPMTSPTPSSTSSPTPSPTSMTVLKIGHSTQSDYQALSQHPPPPHSHSTSSTAEAAALRERESYVLAGALYFGISSGSMLAALLSHVVPR